MRPADTSPEAWKVFIGLMSKMTPGEKLRRALEYSEMVRQFSEAGMRQRYPGADERELFLRMARQNLGRELFGKIYGDAIPDDTRPAVQRS